MTKFEPIEAPNLVYDVAGMRLEYDGWQDIIRGTLIGAHSNKKDTRAYEFKCFWRTAQSVGELKDFRILSESDDPNHYVKGTSEVNRMDVKAVALRTSKLWRDRKLREQATLQNAIHDPAASRLASQTGRGPVEAWWIGEALLLKPGNYGPYNCRKEWIEVVPLKDAPTEVVQYVFNNYIEGCSEAITIEAAQHGLSFAEIKRIVAAEQEHDFSEAYKLMNELVESRK